MCEFVHTRVYKKVHSHEMRQDTLHCFPMWKVPISRGGGRRGLVPDLLPCFKVKIISQHVNQWLCSSPKRQNDLSGG